MFIKAAFDSLAEAIAYRDELLAKLERERRLKQATITGRLNVGELIDIWFNGPPGKPERGFRHRKGKPLSPTTVKDFDWRIGKHIALVANHDVRELLDDPLILEDFFHVQLTPQNARKAFTILNLAFKAAMRGRLGLDRRIPSNPCDFQQLAPLKTAARGVPSADEVAKILIAASEQGDLWDLHCRLTATLGTRRGETCAFRVDDFDIRHRRVHVDETRSSRLTQVWFSSHRNRGSHVLSTSRTIRSGKPSSPTSPTGRQERFSSPAGSGIPSGERPARVRSAGIRRRQAIDSLG